MDKFVFHSILSYKGIYFNMENILDEFVVKKKKKTCHMKIIDENYELPIGRDKIIEFSFFFYYGLKIDFLR